MPEIRGRDIHNFDGLIYRNKANEYNFISSSLQITIIDNRQQNTIKWNRTKKGSEA